MKRWVFCAVLFLVFSLLPDLLQAQGATRRFVAVVTAYTSSRDETDSHPHITASGKRTRPGIVACPRRIPFGTKIRINGRIYQCEDRLHRRLPHRFDLWMPTKAHARKFGKQNLVVEIVEHRPTFSKSTSRQRLKPSRNKSANQPKGK
jgi:3D (Asp-Asp-Asp) domain-containing protein